MPTPTAALPADPLDLIAAWPTNRPLLTLRSAPGGSPWSRRTVFASPQCTLTIRDSDAQWAGEPVENLPDAAHTDPLDNLQHALNATRSRPGLWIGFLSYDLGRTIEPTARSTDPNRCAIDDRHWPLIEFAWCPDVLMHDNDSGDWTILGDVDRLLAADNSPADEQKFPPELGELRTARTRKQHIAAVRAIIDAIAAGDIFQANLTQRFTADFAGSSRALAALALRRSGAWFGGYLELPGDRTICSLSPELFLHVDGETSQVTTRPIKGTRPISTPPMELQRSEKDAAELTMIIDLMRNDLGRVCRFGSVRVPQPRLIETHAGVHHGVGEVTGILRPGCTIAELLRATMPAGSITGAPKIRAMQLIDELEPTRRGPYCGAIGMINPSTGDCTFNVAIRTAALTGRRMPDRFDCYQHAQLDYGAGGAIVADSSPDAEYDEVIDKTAVLRDVIDSLREAQPAVSAQAMRR